MIKIYVSASSYGLSTVTITYDDAPIACGGVRNSDVDAAIDAYIESKSAEGFEVQIYRDGVRAND